MGNHALATHLDILDTAGNNGDLCDNKVSHPGDMGGSGGSSQSILILWVRQSAFYSE